SLLRLRAILLRLRRFLAVLVLVALGVRGREFGIADEALRLGPIVLLAPVSLILALLLDVVLAHAAFRLRDAMLLAPPLVVRMLLLFFFFGLTVRTRWGFFARAGTPGLRPRGALLATTGDGQNHRGQERHTDD